MTKSTRRGLWIAVLLAVVAAVAAPKVLPLLQTGNDPANTAAAATPAPTAPPRVTTVTVAPRRLAETLSTTGSLYANERVDVVSEVAGKVKRILFKEGKPVAAGAVLLEIDATELAAERQRVLSRLELAELREDRQRQLYDDGLISDQEYDAARTELASLRAEVQLIEARLTKTEIRAPFAGVVGLRRVSEGAYLSPQTRVTTLQDVDPVKLEFAVPERYAGALAVGDVVEFRVKSTDRPFHATIYAIEPSVDPETRSLPVRATSPNPGGILLPGSFADVQLTVREVADALTVPSIAVIPELGGKRVFVVEGGAAQPREVETGMRTDTEVEVTSGLAAGDRVIVSGLQMLRPGLAVEVDDAPADAAADEVADSGAEDGGRAEGGV